jgi:hypothetical protein
MRGFHDHFFDVPRTIATTRLGPVELPILYRDVSNVLALFAVPRGPVDELLAGTGLEPALGVRGGALVAMSFYDYRDTSIGPYGEVGVAVFVKRAGAPGPRVAIADLYRRLDARAIGVHVLDLPVTTAIANAAGRELWGYPKFVTPISFELGRDRFAGVVADPEGDAPIVTLAGRLGPGLPAPPMSVVTFSRRDGELVRTHIHVRGAVRARSAGGVRLEVGASRHPMAERLRRLGLDGARPLLLMTTDRFQSRLDAGVAVAAAPDGQAAPRRRRPRPGAGARSRAPGDRRPRRDRGRGRRPAPGRSGSSA